jgi:hypothetical protein
MVNNSTSLNKLEGTGLAGANSEQVKSTNKMNIVMNKLIKALNHYIEVPKENIKTNFPAKQMQNNKNKTNSASVMSTSINNKNKTNSAFVASTSINNKNKTNSAFVAPTSINNKNKTNSAFVAPTSINNKNKTNSAFVAPTSINNKNKTNSAFVAPTSINNKNNVNSASVVSASINNKNNASISSPNILKKALNTRRNRVEFMKTQTFKGGRKIIYNKFKNYKNKNKK